MSTGLGESGNRKIVRPADQSPVNPIDRAIATSAVFVFVWSGPASGHGWSVGGVMANRIASLVSGSCNAQAKLGFTEKPSSFDQISCEPLTAGHFSGSRSPGARIGPAVPRLQRSIHGS